MMKKLSCFILLIFFLLVGGSHTLANSNQMIIINKNTNQLAYYNQGKLEKTFKVATGRQNSYTPEGKFKIVNKIKNRPYYKQNIPGGHPSNPLGDRWLGINARGTYGTTYAIHGNNNPKSIGTYASAGCIRMYNDEIRWLFDRVAVNTPVIITTSKQSLHQIALANGYAFESKVNKLSVSKSSPQPTNASVSVSASVSSGSNTLYKFMVHDGKKWSTIRDFSSTNKVNWQPKSAGNYKLKVQVKNKNSKRKFEDERVLNYTVYQPAKANSLAVNKVSPQPSNTTINLTAQSNNNTNNQFKFSFFDGKKWVDIQKYSSNNKATWKPTKAGNYQVRVQVKNKHSKKSFDSERIINYTVFNEAKINTLSFNHATPQPINKDITITAQSNDNSNNRFRFLVFDGQKWVTIQDFSTKRTVSWKPAKAGAYQIKVQGKHRNSKKAFDHEKVMTYNVFHEATLSDISLNPVSPQPTDTNITITAQSNDNSNNHFKFLIFDGQKWVTIQDFSSKRSTSWKPLNAGDYQIKVQVKHKHSKKNFDHEQIISYTVYDPAKIVAFNMDRESPQFINNEIHFTVNSHDPSNHLYRFSIFDGSSWDVVQDYSPNNNYRWVPISEGTYTIKSEVKHKNSTHPFDDSEEIIFTIE